MTAQPPPIVQQKIFAALHDTVVGIVNPLIDAVCPIYRADKDGEPSAEASAVLTKVGPRHFLFTAAHAVAHIPDEPMSVGGAESIIELDGEFFRTSPPPAGGPDRFDLAVWPLSTKHIEDLGPSRFIDLTEMDLTHQTDHTPLIRSCYLPVGYPSKKQAPRRGDQMVAVPMHPVLNGADPRKYGELGFSPDTHLLLEFERRHMQHGAKEITAPMPKGVSGGGIWHIPGLTTLTPGPARLVAIFTEYHERHHRTAVGVRIAAGLVIIAKRFPDLAPLIYASGLPVN